MYALARISPDVCETLFTRGLYRIYGTAMSFVTGLLPFSLAEFALVGAIAAWLVLFIRRIVIIIKSAGMNGLPEGSARRSRRKTRAVLQKNGREKLYLKPLGKNEAFFGPVSAIPENARVDETEAVGSGYHILLLVRNIFIAAGIVFLWFMIGCGTNYYRHEFAYYSEYDIRESTTEELYDMCMDLAQRTNDARSHLDIPQGEVYCMDGILSPSELAADTGRAMDVLELYWPQAGFGGYYPKTKAALISRIMSEFNITGFYFPWTVEANVNVDVPDYSIAATMCHELSHLRGFMREDEANYLGYYACVHSDSYHLKYSGYMLALVYAGNRLYADSPELYYELVRTYDDGVWLDLLANNEYWAQFEDTVYSEVGEKVNDTYLKANNQKDGTRSYGRMVDLLLAEYRSVAGARS